MIQFLQVIGFIILFSAGMILTPIWYAFCARKETEWKKKIDERYSK